MCDPSLSLKGRVQELIRSGHERQEVKNKMLERHPWDGGIALCFRLRHGGSIAC